MYALGHCHALNPMKQDLLRKVPADKPYTDEVRRLIEGCFSLCGDLAWKRQEISDDRTLSLEKKRAARRTYMTEEFAPRYASASRAAKRVLNNAESERKATFDGAKLKELDELSDAYSLANAAAGVVRVDMANASGMSKFEFESVMAAHET